MVRQHSSTRGCCLVGRRAILGAVDAHTELTALIDELRHTRLTRGIAQGWIATRVGVAPGSVTDWEAHRDVPSSEHWLEWIDGLDLALRVIYDGRAITPEQSGVAGLLEAMWILRRERGVTQDWVAQQMGVTRWSVIRWEARKGNPRPLGLLKWAHALGGRVVLIAGNGPGGPR